MKATEDPRAAAEYGGDYSEEEEDSSSYDSDGSSSESSPSSSREQWSGKNNEENCYYGERNENSHNSISNNINNSSSNNNSSVLVVAGCKSCLMYYMVPKQLEICPKCCGQLLHFDRSENGSSWISLSPHFPFLESFGAVFCIRCWCGMWSFRYETKRILILASICFIFFSFLFCILLLYSLFWFIGFFFVLLHLFILDSIVFSCIYCFFIIILKGEFNELV